MIVKGSENCYSDVDPKEMLKVVRKVSFESKHLGENHDEAPDSNKDEGKNGIHGVLKVITIN